MLLIISGKENKRIITHNKNRRRTLQKISIYGNISFLGCISSWRLIIGPVQCGP